MGEPVILKLRNRSFCVVFIELQEQYYMHIHHVSDTLYGSDVWCKTRTIKNTAVHISVSS